MSGLLPATYNFPDVLSGDTMTPVTFDFGDLDLSGVSAVMQFRDAFAGNVVAEVSTANSGISITGNVLTVGVFAVPQTDARANYLHDLELTFPNGEIRTYIQGRMTVLPDVTRV